MNKQASETIPGSYSIVKMPDGSQSLVEKLRLDDGSTKWVFVEDRIKESESKKQFEDRFNDTTTIPNDFNPVTDGCLVKNNTKTINHLQAHLVEVLGAPERILKQRKLDTDKLERLKNNKSERQTIIKIIDALNIEQWNEIKNYI